jgi:hypothetical protein
VIVSPGVRVRHGPVCRAHRAELTKAEAPVEGEELRQRILRPNMIMCMTSH